MCIRDSLHPNRKARASSVPTKFGIQVEPKGDLVFDAIVQTNTLLQGKLGCKTWSELGLACATDCVVQIKLRSFALVIVLTDRIGIKAHTKRGRQKFYVLSCAIQECMSVE